MNRADPAVMDRRDDPGQDGVVRHRTGHEDVVATEAIGYRDSSQTRGDENPQASLSGCGHDCRPQPVRIRRHHRAEPRVEHVPAGEKLLHLRGNVLPVPQPSRVAVNATVHVCKRRLFVLFGAELL